MLESRYFSAFVLFILLLNGCGSSKQAGGDAGIPGLGVFDFRVNGTEASLTVIFENLNLDVGGRIPLQRPQGAFIEIGPDFQSGGSLVKLSVPVASLLQNHGDLPQVGLPDGRALPGVKSGVLGAVAVELPGLGLTYLYLSADAFGVFYPVDLPTLPVMASSKIKDEKGNLLGLIYGIPKSGRGTSSGVLFLFPVN